MNKRFYYLACLCLCLPMLASCVQTSQDMTGHTITSNSLSISTDGTRTPEAPLSPTPGISIVQQRLPSPATTHSSAEGLAPYGQPPALTALETQLTQKLFDQINQDRASLGLYAYTWNATLASGARLHSWNMYHCGFSHTCPNGESQCARISNEGFAGYTDCGECIGLAGPSNPAWKNVYAVQESMMNEPATGWHRIHLTSKTLHKVGVGIYIAPNGWVWFTEDLVS